MAVWRDSRSVVNIIRNVVLSLIDHLPNFFMDLRSILLLLTVIANAALGVFIFASNPRGRINRIYSVTIIGVVGWAGSILLFFATNRVLMLSFSLASSYFFALIIALSFYYFSVDFPSRLASISQWRFFIIWPPFFILLILLFFSPTILHPFFIRRVIALEKDRLIILGPAHWLYTIYFPLLMGWAFLNLRNKFNSFVGLEKIQIKYVFIGTLIATCFGALFNLFFLHLSVTDWIWLGPVFSLIMTTFIAYAIVKHHLMNIKVIATELLTAIIVLVLLVEFLLSKSPAEFVLRGIFLFIVSLIGYLLIKSVLNEVHQREQLEVLTKQLESANKELERLDQAKSEFLSIASHQLRTPLTAIKGYSSMLLDGTFGPVIGKVKEGVEKVFASTERMVALVNDLLDTSRLDSGRMVFTFVETDLGEITKSVCDELMPKGREKGLAIACTVAPTTPKVFVDQMKIRQVLVNFVDNALKYSDTGMVEVKLECRSSTTATAGQAGSGSIGQTSSDNNVGSDNNELVFSVHDNGWGMTQEEMGFLFKKFSRGRGDTSQIKGTGLGLYVARRLAEAHGGRVWAESAGKGQGSTFFLALKVGWRPSADGVYQPKEE